MKEYQIKDQLDQNGKVIDKLALITYENITKTQILKSKTELEKEKAKLEEEIATKQAEVDNIDTILNACNTVEGVSE